MQPCPTLQNAVDLMDHFNSISACGEIGSLGRLIDLHSERRGSKPSSPTI